MAFDPVGTYVSDDKLYILKIQSVTSTTGNITGTFTSKESPIGEITYKINNDESAHWSYTSNENVAGFGFMVRSRPENRSYVLFDSWAGWITVRGEIMMSGARSYTQANTQREVFSMDSISLYKEL